VTGGVLDPRGCLTDAGLAVLAEARPGGAPPELAQHIAACARCQDRWLQSESKEPARPRATPEQAARRRWGMLALVVGMLVFALLALVATLHYVTGG
jgi:hypothetical protein